MRHIIDNSVSASYYFFVFEFDICYALFVIRYSLFVIRYSLHEYTGISQLKSSCCSLRCTMLCIFKLSKWQIAHKGKYGTKTAHVSSSICQCSPISLPFHSFSLTVHSRCLRHLQLERVRGEGGGCRHCCTAHTSCAIQCIISLPLCCS